MLIKDVTITLLSKIFCGSQYVNMLCYAGLFKTYDIISCCSTVQSVQMLLVRFKSMLVANIVQQFRACRDTFLVSRNMSSHVLRCSDHTMCNAVRELVRAGNPESV